MSLYKLMNTPLFAPSSRSHSLKTMSWKITRSKSVDYSTLNDEEVIHCLKNGEEWAMAILYDRYARLVFSLALKILNDRSAAEECVQEVFVKVWRRARDYDAD